MQKFLIINMVFCVAYKCFTHQLLAAMPRITKLEGTLYILALVRLYSQIDSKDKKKRSD